jgi:sugar phosphate isomerase/epimerase
MLASMWSSYLIELSPEEMAETLVKYGWKHSEFSDEHGWALLERGKPEKVGKEFKEFAEKTGISFPQGHFYLTVNIASPDKAKREKMKDDLKLWCDLFNAMEIKAGVLHPGSHNPDYEEAFLDELRVEMLEFMLDYSKGASFTICLENLILEYTKAEEILRLIGAARGGERLGICLDTGHLNMNGGSCAEFVKTAGNRLKALHITDSIGDHDDHILPFGGGNIDWHATMKALKEVGYSGAFNFEVPRENKCPMSVRLAKLEYAKKLADAMINLQ